MIPSLSSTNATGKGPTASDAFGGGTGFAAGGVICIGVFAIVATQALGWWFGVHAGAWALVPAAGAMLLAVAAQRPALRRPLLYQVPVCLLIAILLGAAPIALRDPSWDGLAYHAPAVVEMLRGWNPVHADTGRLWIDHYPNAAWAARAALADLAGGNPAFGRLLTALVAVAALAILREFLTTTLGVGRFAALAIAALGVFSPIVLAQMWTDYVDGLLGLYALGLLLALLAMRGPRPTWALLIGVILAVLTAATKIAGLYYVFVLTLVAMLWHLLQAWRAGSSPAPVLGHFAVLTAAVCVLLVIIAWRPYVTNILDHGALIHPPVETAMGPQRPDNLQGAGPAVRTGYLLFSTGSTLPGQGEALELRAFDAGRDATRAATYDSRGGGFGPLFGFQLLLAGALAAWAARTTSVTDDRLMWAAIGCLGATFFFPESWWARLVPLAWVGSVLLAARVLVGNHPQPVQARAGFGLVAVLALYNAVPFGINVGSEAREATREFRLLADELRPEPAVALAGSESNFFDLSYGHELSRAGVAVTIEADCDGSMIVTRYAGELRICRPSPKDLR